MTSAKKGILLSNLGSPEAPTPEAVRPYLNQFLMDPYVIDVPWLLRAILIKGFVLPKRSIASAHAYQIIWTPEGSPLVVSTRKLTEKVQKILGANYSVKFAMRYGNPSFQNVLDDFLKEGIREVTLLPLYPQWALASTGSTLAHVKELKHKCKVSKSLKAFYNQESFIELLYNRVVATQKKFSETPLKTHYLFSFHGIPERHIRKSPGCAKCPIDSTCCLKNDAPELCYRSHCMKTAHAVAKKLDLDSTEFTISFQSRLGPDPWLKPFTDVVLKELPARGVERLVIMSPAFTADCLETLEELGVRGKDDFLNSGGKEYILVPSLNADQDWAELISTWVSRPDLFNDL